MAATATAPPSSANDPTLVRAIAAAARATGADAALMVATSMVESGLRWRPTPGDNGTSFGPFQHHVGGALGSHPPSWASTVSAVVERARAFARAGASTGTGAAAVQRPADQPGYAAKVNAALPEARALLARYTTGAAASGAAAPPRTVTTTGKVPVGTAAVAAAQTQLGVPYKWGGATPSTGFDCSGLIRWVFAKFGVNLPHNAAAQFSDPQGKPVDKGALQAGDVVFFANTDGPGITHNGIYVGGGKFIDAPHTGASVTTADLTSGYYADHYAGARRFASGRTTTATTVGGTATVGTTGGSRIPGLPVDIPTPADVAGGAADAVTGATAGIAGAITGLPAAATGAAEDVAGWTFTNVVLPSMFVLGGIGLALYGISRAFGSGQRGGGGGSTFVLGGGGGGAGAKPPPIPVE